MSNQKPSRPGRSERAALRQRLHAWFEANGRSLPWRRQPSLYATVVSEFMLQQTQVNTVLPYFQRWMDALPDFASLAEAPEETVLKLWEGLGYYARARNLHLLAKTLSKTESPPHRFEQWCDLPGVGPYTAAAITSIVFDVPKACVDVNVIRVLTRLRGDRRVYRDTAEAAKSLGTLAATLLDRHHPGRYNEAMMELGATICHRRDPACTECPVRDFCASADLPSDQLPPRFLPRSTRPVGVTRLWIETGSALLLQHSGNSGRRLTDLYELPFVNAIPAASKGIPTNVFAVRKRAIGNERITETILLMEPTPAMMTVVDDSSDLVWIEFANLRAIALSGPHRRWIGELLKRKKEAER